MIMNNYLTIGTLGKAHGIYGWIEVIPKPGCKDLFFKVTEGLLTKANNAMRRITFEEVRNYKRILLVKFSGISTKEDAESLRKQDIIINKNEDELGI